MSFLKKFLTNLAVLVGLGLLLMLFFPDAFNRLIGQNGVLLGLVVIVIFIVSAIPQRRMSAAVPEYPYLVRDDFLSPAEQSFYLTLRHTIADQALICPKVSLADLFYVKSNNPSKFRAYTNKIDRKHVDFLLCHPKTAKPLLGIELDDQSHQKRGQQERDEFLEMVYQAAALPLVRIPVQKAYSTTELDALLKPHLNTDIIEPPGQPEPTEKSDNPPLCPKCGNEMVLKTAKKGSNQGKQFWGCPDYPRCRGILEY